MPDTKIPPTDSSFWILTRQLCVIIVLAVFSLFAYKNKMSATDLVMILTALGSMGLHDVVKNNIAPLPPEETKPNEPADPGSGNDK